VTCNLGIAIGELTYVKVSSELTISGKNRLKINSLQDLRRTKLLGLLSRAGKRSIGDAAWLVLC
jgi:hypothetical protein